MIKVLLPEIMLEKEKELLYDYSSFLQLLSTYLNQLSQYVILDLKEATLLLSVRIGRHQKL